MLPTRNVSGFQVVGAIPPDLAGEPEEETPLFAADPSFARASGGPITRFFVDLLPESWQDDDVCIDSSLVWLTPGLAHDEQFEGPGSARLHRMAPVYRHEPFPGCRDGVRGAANRAVDARFRVLAVGGPALDFASGLVELGGADDPEGFWVPTDDLDGRDARIRRWLQDGALRLQPLQAGLVAEHGWGAFRCPRAAETSGFQFLVRAARGDGRPVVNGVRNVGFV